MKTALIVIGSIFAAFTLMIGGCVAVVGGGAAAVSNEMEKQEKQEKVKADSAPVGEAGTPLTNAGTTYTVTDVENTSTIGDNEYSKETTNGTFVVVELELLNEKNETKTFMSNSAKLRTTDGKEYEVSDKSIMAFDNSLIMEDIQPELATSGKLAFELPASKAAGAQLVIEDLWGEGSIKFDLGL